MSKCQVSQEAHLVDQLVFLFRGPELEEFLYDVVSKDVSHEAVGSRENLLEDKLLLAGRCSLQLLLNEPGAVLVLAEFHDVICQVSQLEVGIPIIPAII